MTDLFSHNSDKYSRFRPHYPAEMIRFILSHLKEKQAAWDCGTGNGQLALQLSPYFDHIIATDISENQLKNAVQKDNITYIRSKAEDAFFSAGQFDLITVAQAIHWFDFNKFYEQVNLALKPEGLFVIAGYGLMETAPEQDGVIRRLYEDILGPYWKPQRKYIEEEYKTIPFPWREIKTPDLTETVSWTANDLIGYLKTWSSVNLYEIDKGINPVNEMEGELRNVWGSDKREVRFPILLRAGKKH